MKLNSFNGKGVETNSHNNESVEFGIGDPSVIIEILRNRLYSNPIQTLVQEYICNARDAHREAGKDKTPIQVGLPSSSNLIFSVRDFGCGLSPEQVKNVFVNYGTSTKRKSDKMTGGFGIGAKSAWAYTDNFTVKAVFDGYERHYVAHIGTKNNGVLDRVYEGKTDKVNQTTIEIAVKPQDCDSFINAALRATLFWKVKPEFSGRGNEFSEWVHKEGKLVGPSLYANLKPKVELFDLEIYDDRELLFYLNGSKYYNNDIFLVVDEIPYSLGGSFSDCYRSLFQVIRSGEVTCVRVGNGDCEVSASREKISDSSESKKRIKSVLDVLSKKIEEYALKKKNELKSFVEFKNFCYENYEFYTREVFDSLVYNGWFLSGTDLKSKTSNHELSELKYDVFWNYEQRSKKNKEKRMILRKESDNKIIPFGFSVKATHVYYADQDYSEVQVKDRIRAIFSDEEKGQFVVFKTKEASAVSLFEAKPLSSIKVDKKTRIFKPKENNKFTITVYNPDMNYYRSRKDNFKNIKASNENPIKDGATYVYSTYNSQSENPPRLFKVANDLKKYGIRFCLIDEKFTDKVKGLSNFVSVDKFFSDFTTYVNDKNFYFDLISNRVASLISLKMSDSVVDAIKTKYNEIGDVKITKYFDSNHKFIKSNSVSYSNRMEWIEIYGIDKKHDEIYRVINETDELIQHLENKYPLILEIRENSYEKRDIKSDLIFYMKAKNKK